MFKKIKKYIQKIEYDFYEKRIEHYKYKNEMLNKKVLKNYEKTMKCLDKQLLKNYEKTMKCLDKQLKILRGKYTDLKTES